MLESPSQETELGRVRGGVGGLEEVGLRIVKGVPVREGSWLAIGVISVPISLMDTERTVGAGVINVEALRADADVSCWLRQTAEGGKEHEHLKS